MKSNRFQLQNLYLSPRNKQLDTARKIYLNDGLLSKTSRNQQCKNGMIKQLNLKKKLSKGRSNMSLDPMSYSDRKNVDHEKTSNQLRREASVKQRVPRQKSINFKCNTKHSNTTRLNSSTSRLSKLQKTQKSTMMTELQSNAMRIQKQKQNKKNHQSGKNCRLIIIQGTNEQEHFVTIDRIGDIMTYLAKEYPRYKYYKTIPSQLTIDYFLMEGTINGKFLNGQSLYLKPCGRPSNSLDDKEQVGLHSFEIIRQIGSGGFSKVFLCRYKEDGQFYAMKVIDKQVIVKNKKKRIIMNERNIMAAADHTFVIDMKFAFQSEKYLVFVMEYCAGGELFGLIKKHRRIQQDMARFYIIQIFLGLSYLHSQKVVYRDIKPQNILLCQDGHVKIADLGLAKPDMFEGELAYSFCGSPEYMSPQMILQVGHTYPVDYYCMGALLYQLLTGLPPFYSRDPNQIYEAVLSEDLTFPSDLQLSSECKSLLKGLLCKQPKQRLGSIHGIKQIFAHPWFRKNQYKKFLDKEIQPPTNFSSIGKVNLDNYTDEQKNKKQLEEVKKQQKIQKKKFKEVMRGFYYDYREKDAQTNDRINDKQISNQIKFSKKSASNKKIRQSSKESKKQNSLPKEAFMNLGSSNQQFKSNVGANSLRKLGNFTARSKLLNQRENASGPGYVLKNILNSERR